MSRASVSNTHAEKSDGVRQRGGLGASLARKKPYDAGAADPSTRTLKWYDLTAYGIAATVGSGIFSVIGNVARSDVGPAVIFSTLGAGALALMTGIVYLEFASAIPVSGCGYAYCYSVLGELIGWMVGWNLTFEYAFAASYIASSWSTAMVGLVGALAKDSALHTALRSVSAIRLFGADSFFRLSLISPVICVLVGLVVTRGVSMGARVTNCITILNLSIILFIIGYGWQFVKTENWAPFVPSPMKAVSGVSTMFFSFIGYDTIASLASDAMNPSRDLPIAVGVTISTATGLYILMGLVLTGMVPYGDLVEDTSVSSAFSTHHVQWAFYVVSVGSLLTMLATLFACTIGQPKIFKAIAEDGLLPRSFFASVNGCGAPARGIMFTAFLSAAMCLVLDTSSGLYLDIATMGTLLGMCVICGGLLVARFQKHAPVTRRGTAAAVMFFVGALASTLCWNQIEPRAGSYLRLVLSAGAFLALCVPSFLAMVYYFVRYSAELGSISSTFACPLMPVLPCVAIFSNVFAVSATNSILVVFLGFLVWTGIGLGIYFFYGIDNSLMAHPSELKSSLEEKQQS